MASGLARRRQASDGEPALAQDAGARAVLERGVQEDQARFESAVTSAPIGMALIDMGGHPPARKKRRRLRAGLPHR